MSINLEHVWNEIFPTGKPNAIQQYLIDEIESSYFDSVSDVVSQFQSAACAHGSWSGMIYTRDILDRLADRDWQDAIEQAFEEYTDATGESPDLTRDSMGYATSFRLESLVTFAVDWYASDLASRFGVYGTAYIATIAADSCDPNPERTAFLCEYEAEEWIAGAIQARMEYLMQHSQTTWTEAEEEAVREHESQNMLIEVESF